MMAFSTMTAEPTSAMPPEERAQALQFLLSKHVNDLDRPRVPTFLRFETVPYSRRQQYRPALPTRSQQLGATTHDTGFDAIPVGWEQNGEIRGDVGGHRLIELAECQRHSFAGRRGRAAIIWELRVRVDRRKPNLVQSMGPPATDFIVMEVRCHDWTGGRLA
jgi:hypothetical protein